MSTYQWFLVGYWASNVLTTVVMIGKNRKPITPPEAAFAIVLYAAQAWATVRFG